MSDYRKREKRIDKHAGLKRGRRIPRGRGEQIEKPLVPRSYCEETGRAGTRNGKGETK